MPLKYRRKVYTDFSIFAGEAVQKADDICKTFKIAHIVGNVLCIIAAIMLRLRWFAFSALCGLLSGGSLVFFGSIAAFVAANPAIAGLLMGSFGLGFTMIIWKNGQLFIRIKDVIDSYEGDFKECQPGLENTAEVELLMKRLVEDIIRCAEWHWGICILHQAGISKFWL